MAYGIPPNDSFHPSSIIIQEQITGARTPEVTEAGTHLGAPALLPADADAGSLVVFDGHVALVIAILADDDALKASHGALEVCFTTQILLGLGPGLDLGRLHRQLQGIIL